MMMAPFEKSSSFNINPCHQYFLLKLKRFDVGNVSVFANYPAEQISAEEEYILNWPNQQHHESSRKTNKKGRPSKTKCSRLAATIICSSGPDKWNATTFDRHYYPKENWTQDKVGTLELQAFKKFLKARNIERQLSAGVKKHLISDSDTPDRGITTSKRKAVTKEKETTQVTHQSNGSSNPITARDDSGLLLDLPPGPLPSQTTKVGNEDYNNLADQDGHTYHSLDNSTQMETNAANIEIESHSVNTPYAINPSSQFTPGYPSLNLPNTPSPTINSSWLAPTTVNLQPSQSNNYLSKAIEIESWETNAASTIPFANNPPSQFTPGYPASSNLLIGRMSSAPTPTIDSSLLTASTDPSKNFQSGQHQGNCCQGVLVELQNLQIEVRKLSSLISKSLQCNSAAHDTRAQ